MTTIVHLPVHPWFRFWARLIDTTLFALPINIVVGIILGIIGVDANLLYNAHNEFITFAIIYIPFLCLIEAFLLSTWRTTPGKALFGIRLKNQKGTKLLFGEAMARALLVWFRGLAIGFPVAFLVTLAHAYYVLKHNGVTSWDRGLHITVAHRGAAIRKARDHDEPSTNNPQITSGNNNLSKQKKQPHKISVRSVLKSFIKPIHYR